MKHINYRALAYSAAAILLMTGMVANADIYKWQDENGTWHFSETAPNDQAAEAIDIRVTPPSADVPEEGSTNKNAAVTEKVAEKPLPLSPEIVAKEKARREHNCKLAKENLFNLNHRSRIRYQDKEQGVERYLTEEERAQWIKKSNKEVKENCQ